MDDLSVDGLDGISVDDLFVDDYLSVDDLSVYDLSVRRVNPFVGQAIIICWLRFYQLSSRSAHQ